MRVDALMFRGRLRPNMENYTSFPEAPREPENLPPPASLPIPTRNGATCASPATPVREVDLGPRLVLTAGL